MPRWREISRFFGANVFPVRTHVSARYVVATVSASRHVHALAPDETVAAPIHLPPARARFAPPARLSHLPVGVVPRPRARLRLLFVRGSSAASACRRAASAAASSNLARRSRTSASSATVRARMSASSATRRVVSPWYPCVVSVAREGSPPGRARTASDAGVAVGAGVWISGRVRGEARGAAEAEATRRTGWSSPRG